MRLWRVLTNLTFIVSINNLVVSIVAQCHCGQTDLSESLFAEIVNDGACNDTSICLVNGTTVDPETYEAVKNFNCSSECFAVLGSAPTPATAVSTQGPSTQASVLPSSALIAIIIGAVVVFLFLICVLAMWLRRRKRSRKKANHAITSLTNSSIREDLREIITAGPSSASDLNNDIKRPSVPSSEMTDTTESANNSSSPNRKSDEGSCLNSVEYEIDHASDKEIPRTGSSELSGKEEKPLKNELKSHPIDMIGSPEWDDIPFQRESESDSEAPGWNGTSTSLSRYLQSQGFTAS